MLRNYLFKGILFIIILVSVYYLICMILILSSKDKYLPYSYDNLDYIIVLGGRVYEDETPSSGLKARLDLCIKTYEEQNLDIPIIVSGGQGSDEPVTEAEAMKKYLLENSSIDESKIILEDQATSTYENLSYSKAIIDKINEGDNVLIITNNFHIFRTAILAKRNNLVFSIIGSQTQNKLHSYLREPLAIAKSIVFDR